MKRTHSARLKLFFSNFVFFFSILVFRSVSFFLLSFGTGACHLLAAINVLFDCFFCSRYIFFWENWMKRECHYVSCICICTIMFIDGKFKLATQNQWQRTIQFHKMTWATLVSDDKISFSSIFTICIWFKTNYFFMIIIIPVTTILHLSIFNIYLYLYIYTTIVCYVSLSSKLEPPKELTTSTSAT